MVGPLQLLRSPMRWAGRLLMNTVSDPVTKYVTAPHIPKSPTLAAGLLPINTVGEPVVI